MYVRSVLEKADKKSLSPMTGIVSVFFNEGE